MEKTNRTGPPNKGIAKAKKERKREEANQRQQRYEKLDIDEKIGACSPGSKQHIKLMQEKGQ